MYYRHLKRNWKPNWTLQMNENCSIKYLTAFVVRHTIECNIFLQIRRDSWLSYALWIFYFKKILSSKCDNCNTCNNLLQYLQSVSIFETCFLVFLTFSKRFNKDCQYANRVPKKSLHMNMSCQWLSKPSCGCDMPVWCK